MNTSYYIREVKEGKKLKKEEMLNDVTCLKPQKKRAKRKNTHSVLNDMVFIHHKLQLTSLLALQKNVTKRAITYS